MIEIHAIVEAIGEEEFQNQEYTLVTLDVGEILVIWRALYVNETPCEQSQKE